MTAAEDAHISAGDNLVTSFGSATTLKFGTSDSAAHDTTSAALIKFPTVNITSATSKVILKLTLATTVTEVPAFTGSHIFQVSFKVLFV